jgi:hypothetical protein
LPTKVEFKLSRLDNTEWVGMGAAILLALSTVLPWFTTDAENENSKIQGQHDACISGCNAWQSFDFVQYFLLACCIAPFVLSWIVARGHSLTWNRGEVTAIFGALALTIVIVNGIILGQPGTVEIGLTWGYPVAIFAAAMILFTGAMRATKHQKKEPPGV